MGHPLLTNLFIAHTTWAKDGKGLATTVQCEDALVSAELSALGSCTCLKAHGSTANATIDVGAAMRHSEIKTICARAHGNVNGPIADLCQFTLQGFERQWCDDQRRSVGVMNFCVFALSCNDMTCRQSQLKTSSRRTNGIGLCKKSFCFGVKDKAGIPLVCRDRLAFY